MAQLAIDHLNTEAETDSRANSHEFQMEQTGVSVRILWNIVRRHDLLLISIASIVVLVALVTQLLATPIYESLALVQVEVNQEAEPGGENSGNSGQSRVANEARTFRSRSLAEQVVRGLNLVQNPEFVDDPGDPNTPATKEDIQKATTKLQSMRSISVVQGSDFIEIAVRSPYPDLSASIANQYVTSMQQRKRSLRDERRKSVAGDLDSEASRLRDVAQKAEQQLALFRRKNNMPVGAGSSEDYSQFNRIEVETASANGMRAAGQARSAGTSRAASLRSTAGATSALLQQQQRKLDELNNERARLAVLYGPGHPDIQRVDAEISTLGSNLAAEQSLAIAIENQRGAAAAARERALAQSEASAAAARAGQLAGQLGALRARMTNNIDNMPELARLENDAAIARQAFVAVAQQAETVRSGQSSMGINSHLVSPSAASTDPISPKPVRTVSAALLGSLMLGLLVIYIIELFDNKLRTSQQMRKLFGFRTIGMFPEIESSALDMSDENPVIKDPQSLFAEVARSMQADVADISHKDNCQSVLITSPLPGDGKSTIALSLVAAASAMGRRAILLDLDLRQPSPLQAMQRDIGGPDLADFLTDKVETQTLLPGPSNKVDRQIETSRAVILSTREPVRDPASLIRATRLRQLTTDLRKHFDLVVINGPAVLAVRDARTLTEVADSTIMVASWGETTIEQMTAACELLQNDIEAAVFNKVDYAEHARRGYGDSIQYYYESSPYYSGPIPTTESIKRRILNFFEKMIPNRTSAS